MKAAFETVRPKRRGGHGKAMGLGGVRQDFEFQSWLIKLGMRDPRLRHRPQPQCAGGADVKQLRELQL